MRFGTGDPIRMGDGVRFHFTGWLDGFAGAKKFGTSRGRNPVEIYLGTIGVVPGWSEGANGMRPGEIRRLKIDPSKGFGEAGDPPAVPAGATLYLELECLGPSH